MRAKTAQALRSILDLMEYPVLTLISDESFEDMNKNVLNLPFEFNIHFDNIKNRLKISTAKPVYRTLIKDISRNLKDKVDRQDICSW